jgi:hypothetical protein
MSESSGYRSSSSSRRRELSSFTPLLLLAVALLSWLGFQTYQLVGESQQLARLRFAQEVQVEAAGKVRASLDTVATATAKLAEGGNVNARILLAELRQRGITVNPAAMAAAPPK